jgi:LmbE family N-acetylglucosaminyl deacetylase
MATIVAFHAHPDDEAISMGGTMARAAAAGHRVVLVVATDGARGEFPMRFLEDGADPVAIRKRELAAAAEILGVQRIEMLGYADSGMMGTPGNEDPHSFWQADKDEAAQRLASILTEEQADVLTVYDDHGGYGHPDHIQVHRIGHPAAVLAGTQRVYETTMNRDRIHEMRHALGEADVATAAERDDPDLERIGTSDNEITTAIDVSDWLDVKRRAMIAHASQITPDSWFLKLPLPVFAAAFGTEWFVRKQPAFTGYLPGDRESWLWQ